MATPIHPAIAGQGNLMRSPIHIFCWLFLSAIFFGDQSGWAAEIKQPEWGTIRECTQEVYSFPGVYEFTIEQRPLDGRLKVPTPFPQIVRCMQDSKAGTRKIGFEFNEDATEITLLLPPKSSDDYSPAHVTVFTAENTRQLEDGEILFSALDAIVVGERAKLEKHPGSYRIGFWSDAKDYVSWKYNATRWGKYNVLLTYSTAAPDGTEVEIEMGGAKVTGNLKSTGSWYRYTTIDLGPLYLAEAGEQTLAVKCLKKVGGAVMNLKSVILEPICEGTPPIQAENGIISLHGRDAIILGTTLRYEPNPKKLTLGYWVKPTDNAEWKFTVNKPGEYEIEVSQGCGSGEEGSEIGLSVNGELLRFVVEETGHFQNFKARVIGRVKFETAGKYALNVQPIKIARHAALDLQQVRLLPVKNK